jgi:hypothetical protein
MIGGLKQKLLFFLPSFLLSALAVHLTFAATKPPEQGDLLPQFDLQVPEDTNDSNYLGLSARGRFTISHIEAQVVIIQLFSRY